MIKFLKQILILKKFEFFFLKKFKLKLKIFKNLIKLKKKLILGREIKAKVLYQTLSDKIVEKVDSALLLPLKNEKKRVIGVLEITNIFNDLFGFDEEYFGIVLSEFTNNMVNNLMRKEVLKTEIK